MISIILGVLIVILVALCVYSYRNIVKSDKNLQELFAADMEEIKTDYNED
jgi:hypothetical protein